MPQRIKPSIFNALESLTLLTTFIFTEQFDRNLDLEGVEQSLQRSVLEVLHNFLQSITEPNHPLGAATFAIFSISIVLSIAGFKARKINDVLATYLSIAWAVELLTMNVLLLSPLKSPTLLLIELVLFIPVIVVAFSWWYWRINLPSAEGNTPAIEFAHPIPTPADYLILSLGTFIKNNVTSHKMKTKTAKYTSIANSFIALDILGLTLSRAVSVAIN